MDQFYFKLGNLSAVFATGTIYSCVQRNQFEGKCIYSRRYIYQRQFTICSNRNDLEFSYDISYSAGCNNTQINVYKIVHLPRIFQNKTPSLKLKWRDSTLICIQTLYTIARGVVTWHMKQTRWIVHTTPDFLLGGNLFHHL